jgi:acetylcholinesterase/cholinesterase
VFAYVGCAADDVACMRLKSVPELLEAQNSAIKLDFDTLLLNFLPFAPMVEPGGEIPEQPMDALAAGHMQAMPILSGSLYDEGQLFVYELFPKPLSNGEYKAIIEAVFGFKASRQILDLYPLSVVPGSTDGRQALNILATDLLFYCPLRNITRGYQSKLGVNTMPTYVYRFEHVMSFDCWGPDYQFCVGWACHGSELPFVFNVFTDGVSISYDPTPAELQLTTDTVNAWTNFLTSGNPNVGLSIPRAYPQYLSESDMLVVLEEPGSETQSHVRDQYCNMWDTLGYYY